MIERRILKPWLAVFLYAGLIFLFSCVPAPLVPVYIFGLDKVLHFLEYLPFGFLLCRALTRTMHGEARGTVIITILLTALYALSDEFHQFFVPGRHFSGMDMLMDALGSMSGSLLYLWRK